MRRLGVSQLLPGPTGRGAVLVLAAVLMAAGCTPERDPEATLSVFAASSLREAFEALAEGFEGVHPGVEVTLNFAGSQVLRLQIEQGAAADVFASADREHMDALVHAGLMVEPKVFAYNQLALIVPPDNPSQIATLAQLPKARRLVVGLETVPVGRYTEALLRRAAGAWGASYAPRVHRRVVSRESNVRLVRAKVEMGEADAAIVYQTDAALSPHVRTVAIPEELNVTVAYLMGRHRQATASMWAPQWTAFLVSDRGRQILKRFGFRLPL